MSMSTYSIGVDFGTSSVRAMVVDVATGEDVAAAAFDYPTGRDGVVLDPADPNLARQNPADYFAGLVAAVGGAVEQARRVRGIAVERIVGLGIDTTASTPVPVDRHGTPLALLEEFRGDPDALAWLWKDHTAHAAAAEITEKSAAGGYPYLRKCGGTYSSEWYWAKILHCERKNPRVAAAAFAWIEQCDLLPAFATGMRDPLLMKRGICAAGHKALYHPDWDGLPAAAFLDSLSPGLSRLRARFAQPALPGDRMAGRLSAEIAGRVGLPAGLPVAVGMVDAHAGAVGAGCGAGTLVKIIGTSTCDCMVAPLDQAVADIPGVSGIVPESIVPGMIGIEAGQSAVGDIFNWYVQRIAPSGYGAGAEAHERLSEAAARLRPGESGLLALDWHNGNRNVLVDSLLSGLMVGETLSSTPPEVYRALIEATAFGARRIIERLEEYGVRIEQVVNCGGIAEKNPLVMQIYADVCNRPMKIARATNTCALGAAIFGSVVGGAHESVRSAQQAMTGTRADGFCPIAANVAVYERLYRLYLLLHDAFGVAGTAAPLHPVMKELIRIRQSVRAQPSPPTARRGA